MTACPPNIRAQIDADIAEETRRASIKSIFAFRAASKRAVSGGTGNRPVSIGDNGIETAKETADETGEASDGFDWLHQGEADYRAVCENLTGSIIPDSAFETGRLRRAKQDETSIELARALESTGRFGDKRFFYGENDPRAVTVIGVESGAVVPIPALRRVNFFPSIAAGNRSRMLRDVEHMIDAHPHRSAMFTITAGRRVAIHRVTLRRDFQQFNRRLSKLAARLRTEMDVSVEWAGNELGTLEWIDGQGTLNLHAHLLVLMPENLNPKKRAKIRRKIWRLLTNQETGEKTIWDDAGTIQNPREFVKYPVKDADLLKIVREGGPGLLADLYEALRGLKVCRPMGALRRIRSERRARARRLTAFSRFDGRVLEETGDWNAVRRPLTAPKRHKQELRKRQRALAARLACAEHRRLIGSIAADFDGGNGSVSRLNGGETEETEKRGEQTPAPFNRVIARLAPAPYGGPICEPAVVVWGFNGDVAAVLSQPAVARLREQNAAAYRAAVDARALIRACAGADAPRASSQTRQRSNNCPEALGELALADAENRPPAEWACPKFWNS